MSRGIVAAQHTIPIVHSPSHSKLVQWPTPMSMALLFDNSNVATVVVFSSILIINTASQFKNDQITSLSVCSGATLISLSEEDF